MRKQPILSQSVGTGAAEATDTGSSAKGAFPGKVRDHRLRKRNRRQGYTVSGRAHKEPSCRPDGDPDVRQPRRHAALSSACASASQLRLSRLDPKNLSGVALRPRAAGRRELALDRKSTRLNSSHTVISYAVFCLKKKKEPRYEAPAR